MKAFGNLEVRLDPWEAEYGGEVAVALPGEEAADGIEVEPGVELPFESWRPLQVEGPPSEERILFIDGTRRLDARVLVHDGRRRFHGAFGSLAAGWVEVEGTRAKIPEDAITVHRLLVFGCAGEVPEAIREMKPITVLPGLTYHPSVTDNDEPDAPMKAIHEAMQKAEGDLAVQLRGASLIVADGLADFRQPVPQRTLGYVKRMMTQYLPAPRGLDILAALPHHTRTPIFEIRKEKQRKLSWYVRLGPRELGESEISGLARIECAPMPLAEAQVLADRSVRDLSRFVPSRARDPRSPQNLLPIGALEKQIRHRLGDRTFVRRKIRALLAQEEAHG